MISLVISEVGLVMSETGNRSEFPFLHISNCAYMYTGTFLKQLPGFYYGKHPGTISPNTRVFPFTKSTFLIFFFLHRVTSVSSKNNFHKKKGVGSEQG